MKQKNFKGRKREGMVRRNEKQFCIFTAFKKHISTMLHIAQQVSNNYFAKIEFDFFSNKVEKMVNKFYDLKNWSFIKDADSSGAWVRRQSKAEG